MRTHSELSMHFLQGQDRHQLFMTSMDQMVPGNSLVRLIDRYVNELPIEQFGFVNSKNNKAGNQLYHPKDLLKLILFAYKKGIRSAPKMANMAQFNLETIWLLKGLHPSSRTINYFRAKHSKAIAKAGIYINQKLRKMSH